MITLHFTPFPVVNYGFTVLRLHCIEALLNPANTGSSAVLESRGFVKEAHLKESFILKVDLTTH